MSNSFPQPLQNVKTILHVWVTPKQVAGWTGPMGHNRPIPSGVT